MNFQTRVGNLRRKHLTAAARRPAKRPARLKVESLEDRAVPAVLPAPVVDQTSFRSVDDSGFGPVSASNPLNPDHQILAYVKTTANRSPTDTRMTIRFTTTGGTTWSGANVLPTAIDPKSPPTAPFPFAQVSNASVAFDRFNNVFVTYTEFREDFTSGRIVLRKFSLNPANNSYSESAPAKTIYEWWDSTEAFNPVVAVDSNLGSFADPSGVPNGTQNDPLAAAQTSGSSVRVFVAWNTRVVDANNALPPAPVNPNAILMTMSSDGGRTFGSPIIVNDGRYGGSFMSRPKIAITPGHAGEANSGAQMLTMFTSAAGGLVADSINYSTQGVPGVFEALMAPGQTGKPIIDATDPGGGAPHIPAVTNFTINVPASSGLTKIDAISLSLNLRHNSLAELKVELVAPDGLTSFTLFRNQINAAGNTNGAIGITGTVLGTSPLIPTTFTDSAFFPIHNGTEPYRGDYRGESEAAPPGPNPTPKTMMDVFGGLTGNAIFGNWTVRVTDFRASGASNDPRTITFASLKLVQGLKNGLGTDNDVTTQTGVQAVPSNDSGFNYPTASPAIPTMGIGPGLSLAVDNTLGAFSPYQNRIYAAVVSPGSRVRVVYSDNGGQNWNFGATIDRGFLPTLAVDQTTGTLVVSYYTTKFDNSGARSTMMLSTAIDMPVYRSGGGIQFAPGAFITPKEQYFDQIRSKVLDFEPIPSNGTVMGPQVFGINSALAVDSGRVTLVYAGNLNERLTQLRTQDIQITAGPRVVSGDMGPILDAAVVPGRVYNNTFSVTDGSRQFTGFVVAFDRVVDPNSFTATDVTLLYHSPTDLIGRGTGTPILVQDPIPLDDIRDGAVPARSIGSKRYFIPLVTPQSAVGTYSYIIGTESAGTSLVQDRIRGQALTRQDDPTRHNYTNPSAFAIPDAPGTFATSSVNVPAADFPGGRVVGDVNVTVTITHPLVNQLQLDLVSPTGKTIRLVNAGDAFPVANFTNITFDDQATKTLQTDQPPYSGSYRSAEPLADLIGQNPAGQWRLIVTDTVSDTTIGGVLNNWTLSILGTQFGTSQVTGNGMDQNANGVEREGTINDDPRTLFTNEASSDAFAMPDPKNGRPFELPYKAGSLPIVIPGPHVIQTQVVGQTAGTRPTESLIQNKSAKLIDVLFDRTMDAATFTPDKVLRITGPLGDIDLPAGSVTVSPISALGAAGTLAAGTDSKAFRITFPEQKLSGTYRIQLSPNIADTEGATGNLMDADVDAGVSHLTGSVNGVTPVDNRVYGGGTINVPIAANSVTSVPLTVTEAYALARATVTITVVHPHTRELEGRLVAPDGTSVLLFANAPKTGSDNATSTPPAEPPIFTNITFDDSLLEEVSPGVFQPSTPIQVGGTSNRRFNPIQPLDQLIGSGSQGNWRLVITNKGTNTGTIKKFQLNLDRPQTGTGLGEEVADQTPIGFRIFTTDSPDLTSRGNWTPVGPTGRETIDPIRGTVNGTVGRIGAIAVDPSDPSGNTVYAAGASGGVWRTTNFLTHDPLGPSWVPLTDFGPNNAINVGSIALYPDPNGNPLKTTVLVGTGSDSLNRIDQGEFRFDGVGYLLSEDAGTTWQVLDSTDNFDTGAGAYRAIDDAARDHKFVGAVVNKLVFEPNKNTFSPFRTIVYAAVGRGSAAAGTEGLWRSMDGGRTWSQLFQGEASDFVLAYGSALPNSGNRPTIGYLAIRGQGVLLTTNLTSVSPSFNQMNGGVGRPTINSGGVGTDAPSENPLGGKGKITLASPAFVNGSPLANNYLQSWLYAAVSEANGDFDGLYMTKDAGKNWTKLRIFSAPGAINDNDDHPFSFGGGNHSISLAVDPNDPNIVYLGGDFVVRVDATFTDDPYNLSLYQHSNPDNGVIRPLTTGGAQVADRTLDDGLFPDIESGLVGANSIDLNTGLDSITPLTFAGELEPFLDNIVDLDGPGDQFIPEPLRSKWNHLNLVRGPYDPFNVDTSLQTFNVAKFVNTGEDVRATAPGFEGAQDFSWVSQIVTTIDPITGRGRVIYGTDEGLATFVTNDNGSANSVIGFNQPSNRRDSAANLQVNDLRNGDLQVARLYSGDVQPSLLAAQVAQSLFLGVGRRITDTPMSSPNTLADGNTEWVNSTQDPNVLFPPIPPRIGTANYIAADQTGTGTVYILRRINELPVAGELRTDFFQVQRNGGTAISRTNGLFLNEADANGTNSQWDNSVRRFAVNPIDSQGILLGSAQGRLYRTVDQGLNWFIVAEPNNGVLDGTYTSALAFGAPQPNSIDKNEFFYAGTVGGKIFVTTKGGGAASNWVDISAGLDGQPVQKIVANPTSGTHEAFAVTDTGVFHMADWTVPGATWVNITSNLPTIQSLGFGNSSWQGPVVSTATGTPHFTSIAVDWRPTYSPTPGKPILYVGADGGLFQGVENADQTPWIRYAGSAQGAASPGGGLPVVKVTDVDLSIGNIDPNSGRAIPSGTADQIVVTTLGRGMWTIGLQKFAGASGPRIIESQLFPAPTAQDPLPKITQVRVKFDKFITSTTVNKEDLVIKGPSGETFTATNVTEVNPTNPLHNEWLFTLPNLVSDGAYTIIIGPNIKDGPALSEASANPMNQNGNFINGEIPGDQFFLNFTIGRNDIIDFVKDAYQKLLPNHTVTTADLTAKLVAAMDAARLKALSPVARELLLRDDFRAVLISRLYDNGGSQTEIGNLLPGQAPTGAALTALVQLLKDGKKSPQSFIVDILASTTYFPQPTTDAEANAYLTKVYNDLFKGTVAGVTIPDSGIQFSWLPATTQTAQKNQVKTPAGRLTLIRNLVNAVTTVKYNQGGSPTGPLLSTNFRTHLIQLTYAQHVKRLPTSTEMTAGRTQLGAAPAAGQLQGLERLYQAVFSTVGFFSQFNQVGGPDDGLHTDRSWTLGVFSSRFMPAPSTTEVDTFSGQILNGFKLGTATYIGFKAQRQAFLKSLVNSTEFRSAKIKELFKLVHGASRVVTQQEMTTWLNNLKLGSTYAGLVANRLGSTEFFNQAPGIIGVSPPTTAAEKINVWARAVYKQLLNQNLSSTDPQVLALALKALAVGRASAALSLVVNGTAFRDTIIDQSFQLALGRLPDTNGHSGERTFYQDFLKKNNRWELLLIDLMWAGPAGELGREFWEIAG